jgi:hypothetical protein
MSYSTETDRTQVPTGYNTEEEHLNTLSEKGANMESHPDEPHGPSDPRFQNNGLPGAHNDVSDSNVTDKDLEAGEGEEHDPEEEEREEEFRQQEKEAAKDPNLVEWDGPDDPENPMNWPSNKKLIVTCFLALLTFVVTFASSVFSNATIPVSELFHVSPLVSTLGTSLMVFGYSVGPLVGTISPRTCSITNPLC